MKRKQGVNFGRAALLPALLLAALAGPRPAAAAGSCSSANSPDSASSFAD